MIASLQIAKPVDSRDSRPDRPALIVPGQCDGTVRSIPAARISTEGAVLDEQGPDRGIPGSALERHAHASLVRSGVLRPRSARLPGREGAPVEPTDEVAGASISSPGDLRRSSAPSFWRRRVQRSRIESRRIGARKVGRLAITLLCLLVLAGCQSSLLGGAPRRPIRTVSIGSSRADSFASASPASSRPST